MVSHITRKFIINDFKTIAIMKKTLLLFTCLLAFAGTNAQNSLEFTTVSNENDMLYYASPQMDEPQKIVTDAGLIP